MMGKKQMLMTRNRYSKEEIKIVIDAIKSKNNEQYNSNC